MKASRDVSETLPGFVAAMFHWFRKIHLMSRISNISNWFQSKSSITNSGTTNSGYKYDAMPLKVVLRFVVLLIVI